MCIGRQQWACSRKHVGIVYIQITLSIVRCILVSRILHVVLLIIHVIKIKSYVSQMYNAIKVLCIIFVCCQCGNTCKSTPGIGINMTLEMN